MGFNTTRERTVRQTHEGGKAYPMDPAQELYLTVVSSLLSGDSFYESQDKRAERLQTLVRAVIMQGDQDFVVGLAAYAREQMYLRTAPTVLTAELFARGHEGLAAKAADRVWQRGDEHLEALAYFDAMGYKRTKALLRAVAKRLNEMDEFSLTKYRAGNKSYSQRDAIRVSHPVPKDAKQSALFKYMVHDWSSLTDEEKALLPHVAGLKDGGTQSWEQHISKEGSTKESWTEAVEKMGYMALLRNLRNLVEKNVDIETLRKAAAKLTSPYAIAKSKQLPFRFLSAYKAMPPGAPQILFDAISTAADQSVVNVPELEGETLVLVDCSGSMTFNKISDKSEMLLSEAARCLGAILVKRGNCELWGFGDRPVRVAAPSHNPVMATIAGMEGISSKTGHGTAIAGALKKSLNERFRRVIVLTDMQALDNPQMVIQPWLAADKSRRAYICDMLHYGLPSFDPRYPGLVMVGGFSDKIFNWIRAVEKTNPVQEIRGYVK